MRKIDWCFKKKEGIRLVEPNLNVSEAYIKKADDALRSMRINEVREWKISTGYYCLYFSLYSILMKIGVKCEIHSCTIEFAKAFLKDYFDEEDFEFLEDSLKLRVDSQYYVNKEIKDESYEKLLEKAPDFLVKCKGILPNLDGKKIKIIRDKIKRY